MEAQKELSDSDDTGWSFSAIGSNLEVLWYHSMPTQARHPLASMKLIYGMLHHIHRVIQTVIWAENS